METPFWSSLKAYQEKGVIPFHTPGHKLNSGPFTEIASVLGEGVFSLDPSDEIHNANFNHDFELALREAENLAAELFGAQESLFLVNGTTSGLHYLMMPATGPILIPRFSHQAVYSALILGNSEPVYLPTSYDTEWLIPLPATTNQVEEILRKTSCEAVLVTHPTYYGTVSELTAICSVAKKHGAKVFVDEAHGGHFIFSNQLPTTGLASGATAVVQSTHKTLGSFTQTSMLHSNDKEWFKKVRQTRRVLETTSPSLVFLGMLDEVRRVLAEQGEDLMKKTLALAQDCATRLARISHVDLLPDHLRSDPTKIVFSLKDLGLTGIEVGTILRNDYNIQVELSDYYNVLALITLGDSPATINHLVEAVQDLVARSNHLRKTKLPHYKLDIPDLPPCRTSLRQAFFQEQEEIGLNQAIGRVSGGFVTPYPPGVPVIVPGEEFTVEIVEHLKRCSSFGWPIRGLMAGEKVMVHKDYNNLCRK